MRISQPMLQGFLAFSAAVLLNAAAHAAPFNFVASNGADANPCTRAKPCRTLQRGIDVTPAGGELRVLDSAVYGDSATIAKSMTISGGDATITLNAPITINSPTAKVTLREFLLTGRGVVDYGVIIQQATSVFIVDCEIERFVLDGVSVGSTPVELFVTDSILRDNAGDGLRITSPSATPRLTVDNSRFEDNGANGLDVRYTASTVTRTVTSGNGVDGIYQIAGSLNATDTTAANNGQHGYELATGAGGVMTLQSSVARGNASAGLSVTTGNTARISNVVITNNTTGIVNGGTTQTLQNNMVTGNGTNTVGNPLTPLPAT